VIRVRGRGVLGGLIVGLNRGQFINQLFTAVEVADFGQMNFGEPVLHIGGVPYARRLQVLISCEGKSRGRTDECYAR
jgi:hypothetical protein